MSLSFYQKRRLFERLLKGNLTAAETDALVDWLGADDPDEETKALILHHLQKPVDRSQVSPEVMNSLEARLPAILGKTKKTASIRLHLARLGYAAAFIGLAGIGVYLLLKQGSTETQKTIAVQEEKIVPGSNGAILTMADGKTIVLDSLGNGLVASQNGSDLLMDDDALLYQTNHALPNEVKYHTMTTPKGRQFRLVLPDGSRVWLNAASTLKYPAAFAGSERRVFLSGEAYFEVAKNKSMPFRIICDKQTIEVLGTRFNVNSYADEPVATTTIREGSVKVTQAQTNSSQVLKAGQKIIIKDVLVPMEVVASDVKPDISWVEGYFSFDSESLESVMKKIARWYNVRIEYSGNVSNEKYSGIISKFEDVSGILKMLELTNTVKFKIEGQKIIVL